MKKYSVKGMMPYIIINAIIDAIIGAVIAKTTINILNTKRKIDSDYNTLKKFFRDMGGKATHIKLEDIDESDVPEDIRKRTNEAELKEELGEALVTLSETCENSMSLDEFLKR
jgi:hypothetical protein